METLYRRRTEDNSMNKNYPYDYFQVYYISYTYMHGGLYSITPFSLCNAGAPCTQSLPFLCAMPEPPVLNHSLSFVQCRSPLYSITPFSLCNAGAPCTQSLPFLCAMPEPPVLNHSLFFAPCTQSLPFLCAMPEPPVNDIIINRWKAIIMINS